MGQNTSKKPVKKIIKLGCSPLSSAFPITRGSEVRPLLRRKRDQKLNFLTAGQFPDQIMTPKIALSLRAHNCSRAVLSQGGKTAAASCLFLPSVACERDKKGNTFPRLAGFFPRCSSRPRVSCPLENVLKPVALKQRRIGREDMLLAREPVALEQRLYISAGQCVAGRQSARARLIALANNLWPGADTQFSRFNKLVLVFWAHTWILSLHSCCHRWNYKQSALGDRKSK